MQIQMSEFRRFRQHENTDHLICVRGITTYYVLFSFSDELSGSGESSGDIDKFDEDENTSKKIKKYFLYCLTVMQY